MEFGGSCRDGCGGVGHAGVGWVMGGWMGHAEVGWVGWVIHI